MPFTDLARAKAYLHIPAAVTDYDALLTDLVAFANSFVLDEVNLLGATNATYNETFDVQWEGDNEVALTYRPVQTLVAMTNDGQAINLAAVPPDAYAERWGMVRLVPTEAHFVAARQRLQVTYVAGLGTTPGTVGTSEDINDFNQLRQWANRIVAVEFNTGPHAGMESERIGQYSYRSGVGSVNPYLSTMPAIVGKFRRVFARHQ